MSESVNCPNCGAKVDVSVAFKAQIELELNQKLAEQKKKFESEVESKRAEYKSHLEDLAKKERDFEKNFANALNEKKIQLENELKSKLADENSLILKALKDELELKSKQISELNLKTLEIEKIKREKDEFETALRAKSEAELNERLSAEKEKIAKILSEQNELKLRQQDEQMQSLKRQLSDAQRRLEQGSQQLQGEVMELAIQEWLRQNFVLDTIAEVKKGAVGADVMQTINTREAQNCGKIYYESKRTKHFSADWIDKFKSDMRNGGADAGILVSEARPKELERMGMIDGVWVCNYDEFKSLCHIIRKSVIDINLAKKSSQNTGIKTQMLYEYLTSNEFKMRVEAIVDGFNSMSDELQREKNAMNKIWKSREKQIEKVRDSAIHMFGSIKGIAGNAIREIETLELEYIAKSLEYDE